MRLALLQLSDIHMRDDNNSIFKRVEKLIDAIQNELLDIENIVIIISGDIAYSGRVQEYNQAMTLIDSIKVKVKNHTGKQVYFVLVPGNHDCDFEIESKKVRDTLIKDINENGVADIDESIIEQCCIVQNNFVDFSDCYESGKILYKDRLLKIIEYNFDNYIMIFYCFNTSWISQKYEQYGSLTFPLSIYPKDFFGYKSNISISILHHPFNWQNPNNAREIMRHLENTSDLIITGHEHIATKSLKNNLEGTVTEYIEGAILQDDDESNSGFNLIHIDLEKKLHLIIN